jgi:glycine betaine/proline transport system ATP-binding protein
MEGGRLVQMGTAREIIANPVDEYVAEFVAHMNPLGVLTAEDMAEPGAAEGTPIAPETPVIKVMELLKTVPAVALTDGRRITREGVIARLIDPRGTAAKG